jgi:dolichol-phosphate mannosyltransferase
VLSIVVPIHNEAGNIRPLIDEILAASQGLPAAEIIYVDDASSDGSGAELQAARQRHANLRVLRHARRFGQSAGLRTGALAARGPILVTLDGDGQNDPADIGQLLACFEAASANERCGLVIGWRARRQDKWLTRAASRIANAARDRLLHDGAIDTGCGLKVIAREAYLRLPYFDHMHRFLPALMRREGYGVRTVRVGHRPRRHGRSHYGVLDRLRPGLVDLAGVWWLQRRCPEPITGIELEPGIQGS